MNAKKDESRVGNQIKVGEQLGKEPDMFSDAHIMPINDSFQSEEIIYPLLCKSQEQALKAPFQTLGNILEEEKIEIIETGFQLN